VSALTLLSRASFALTPTSTTGKDPKKAKGSKKALAASSSSSGFSGKDPKAAASSSEEAAESEEVIAVELGKAGGKSGTRAGGKSSANEPSQADKDLILVAALAWYQEVPSPPAKKRTLDDTVTYIKTQNEWSWSPGRSTISVAAVRKQTIVRRGKPAILTPTAQKELIEEARNRKIAGNCMVESEARRCIHDLALELRRARGLNCEDWTIGERKMSDLLKLLKEVKRPQVKDLRRAEAENDFWNAVSLAAVCAAAFQFKVPKHRNVWNYDASTLRLTNTGTSTESVFVPHDESKGIARVATTKTFQWVNLKFHCLTNAEGLMGPAIFTLRSQYKRLPVAKEAKLPAGLRRSPRVEQAALPCASPHGM
jgi:hypothetical protein